MDYPTFPTFGKVPWTRKRHREADYVSQVAGVSKMTADKLIRRAKSVGIAYDQVDWDALQGGDLCYEDLVTKLEEQVGKTWTKTEFFVETRLMKEAYEEERKHGDATDC
jgi:hypothetical protein